MSFQSVQTLSIAMQQEMQAVLMEGLGLSNEKLDRLETLARSARQFLTAATPKSLVVADADLSPEAQKIRDARFRALGFSPEHMQHLIHNPVRDAQHRESTEGLIRAAQVFGVGEEEGEEDEEIEMMPSVDTAMPVPVKLVRDVVALLKGTDGDVAEQMGELLQACNVTEQTDPEAMLPIELGMAVMGCIGLAALKTDESLKVGEVLYGELVKASPSWAAQVNSHFERRAAEA